MSVVEYKKLRKGKPRFHRSEKADRTEDGITFDSKAELERYQELKMLKATGHIKGFHRQPLFDLAGVKYHADFQIIWPFGGLPVPKECVFVTYEEVKGKYKGPFRAEALRRWKRNAAQVKELYGVNVELVER